MERLAAIEAVRAWRDSSSTSVGLVPTMGALHEGHLSLVEEARRENERVIVSIFVNPLQFGPDEDLDRYPRDEEGDRALLADQGVDAVWAPELAEMYAPRFATRVEVGPPLTARLEGAARPGHFAGVTTVVAKLLLAVLADRAYFGMKDAQQLLVIARMVQDLAIPTQVVPMATVREDDGVALSSRNRYLGAAERAAAQAIPGGLDRAARMYADGVRDAPALVQAVRGALAEQPLLGPEYVSCADVDSLDEVETIHGPALLSLAVKVGSARLIDNRWLGIDRTGLLEHLGGAADPDPA